MYVATVVYVSADFDLSFVTNSDLLSGARYDFVTFNTYDSSILPQISRYVRACDSVRFTELYYISGDHARD